MRLLARTGALAKLEVLELEKSLADKARPVTDLLRRSLSPRESFFFSDAARLRFRSTSSICLSIIRMSSSLACVPIVLVFGRLFCLFSRAEAGRLLCGRYTIGSSPTYTLLLLFGGTEPGRVPGMVTYTLCRLSAFPAGVSGRDIGLDGAMRGPGGALVARGGKSLPGAAAAGDLGAMPCGLGLPRAAAGMPVAVAGRFGLSLPTP